MNGATADGRARQSVRFRSNIVGTGNPRVPACRAGTPWYRTPAAALFALLVSPTLPGCSLTRSEIETLLDRNEWVLVTVDARLQDIETYAGALRHGQGDGAYGYDGTIAGDGYWSEGEVHVVGTSISQDGGTALSYDLDLTYAGVTVDEVVLDGTIAVAYTVITENYDVTWSWAVDGELDLAGAARGHAVLDYGWVLDTGGTAQPVYSGTINGRDVSRLDP